MSALCNEQRLRLLTRTDIEQDVAAFLLDCRARRLSPRTVERYREELLPWTAWLRQQAVQSVYDLTPSHLRSYIEHLAETRNPGGQHIAFRVLRTFLRWYEREYEPRDWRNPISKVKAPKLGKDVLEPVPLADLKAMLGTCDTRSFRDCRDKAILLTLLDTGCRASEFIALDVGDLDLSTGAVRIRHGKGDKGRYAFVGAKTRQVITRYLRRRGDPAPSAPLWIGRTGDRLTYWGLRMILQRSAKAAGVPAPSLHSFRRAFALGALRAGVDLVSLQRLLGHSDLSVISRYLRQTQDDLRRAHEKAGPVDNLL